MLFLVLTILNAELTHNRGNVILFNASRIYPGYINFIAKEGDLIILDASFAYLDASSMYSQQDITPNGKCYPFGNASRMHQDWQKMHPRLPSLLLVRS